MTIDENSIVTDSRREKRKGKEERRSQFAVAETVLDKATSPLARALFRALIRQLHAASKHNEGLREKFLDILLDGKERERERETWSERTAEEGETPSERSGDAVSATTQASIFLYLATCLFSQKRTEKAAEAALLSLYFQPFAFEKKSLLALCEAAGPEVVKNDVLWIEDDDVVDKPDEPRRPATKRSAEAKGQATAALRSLFVDAESTSTSLSGEVDLSKSKNRRLFSPPSNV